MLNRNGSLFVCKPSNSCIKCEFLDSFFIAEVLCMMNSCHIDTFHSSTPRIYVQKINELDLFLERNKYVICIGSRLQWPFTYLKIRIPITIYHKNKNSCVGEVSM